METTLTVSKLLAILGAVAAIASFWVPGPLLIIAVVLLALAMLV